MITYIMSTYDHFLGVVFFLVRLPSCKPNLRGNKEIYFPIMARNYTTRQHIFNPAHVLLPFPIMARVPSQIGFNLWLRLHVTSATSKVLFTSYRVYCISCQRNAVLSGVLFNKITECFVIGSGNFKFFQCLYVIFHHSLFLHLNNANAN